jgi:hypothetical protein
MAGHLTIQFARGGFTLEVVAPAPPGDAASGGKTGTGGRYIGG